MDVRELYFPRNMPDGEIIAKIIIDTAEGRLYGEGLDEVIKIMEERGMFENRQSFTKKDTSEWNSIYLNELKLGVNRISSDYLHYIAEVAEYVKLVKEVGKKRRIITYAIGATVIVGVILIVKSC